MYRCLLYHPYPPNGLVGGSLKSNILGIRLDMAYAVNGRDIYGKDASWCIYMSHSRATHPSRLWADRQIDGPKWHMQHRKWGLPKYINVQMIIPLEPFSRLQADREGVNTLWHIIERINAYSCTKTRKYYPNYVTWMYHIMSDVVRPLPVYWLGARETSRTF